MRSKVFGLLPFVMMALACEPSASQPRDPSGSTSVGPSGSETTSSSNATPDPQATATPTSSAAAVPVPPPPADAITKLATGTNTFGFDLYQRLRKTPGNIVMSPASITTALSMTWGGAKGETAAQMKKVLHLDGTPDDVMKTAGQLAQSLEDPSRPI